MGRCWSSLHSCPQPHSLHTNQTHHHLHCRETGLFTDVHSAFYVQKKFPAVICNSLLVWMESQFYGWKWVLSLIWFFTSSSHIFLFSLCFHFLWFGLTKHLSTLCTVFPLLGSLTWCFRHSLILLSCLWVWEFITICLNQPTRFNEQLHVSLFGKWNATR